VCLVRGVDGSIVNFEPDLNLSFYIYAMDVQFGATPIQPSDARHTEITTYMWPGFLGELDHSTDVFRVWEIVGPTCWKPRPDILVPPYTCMGVERVPTQVWGPYSLQGSLWRRLTPH
jgi:hypothetical protein